MKKELMIALIFLLSGCYSFVNEPLPIIEFDNLSPICKLIVEANGFEMVRRCYVDSFQFQGNDIHFVKVQYGPAQDCPSGCFYSSYTSIVEKDIEYKLLDYPRIYDLAESLDDLRLDSVVMSNIRYAVNNVEGNESECNLIPYDKYKNPCLIKYQKKLDREYLFSHSSFKNKNVSICYNVKNNDIKEDCIRAVADNTEDPNLCDEITNLGVKYPCYRDIITKTLEEGRKVCNRIDPNYGVDTDPPGPKVRCLTWLARRWGDVSVCNEILNTDHKKICIMKDISS